MANVIKLTEAQLKSIVKEVSKSTEKVKAPVKATPKKKTVKLTESQLIEMINKVVSAYKK
jgi:flagellar hook-basal body complex protein FliE